MSIPTLLPAILRLVFVSVTFVSLTTTATADAIDGDWCAKMGRHLNIDGVKIKTPGGDNITGDYDRHGFTYVVPNGETHASKTIHMRMQSEDLVLLTLPDGSVEKWNRCQIIS